jgi:glycosyltransferase involved in cell wall biosynthesis
MPRVSVIITTHNRPEFLPRAVESALSAGADVEIVVVDDASVDETAEICRRMNGIRYVRVERNQRVAGARNLGILASTGDYITFLDDDDIRLAHSLNLQVSYLESTPDVGLVYGQVLEGDQNCIPTGERYPIQFPQGDVFWKLLEGNFIPCVTALFRRSCLYRMGLLDEAAPGVDDWDLWIRIAELYQVAAVEQPVAIWRRSTPGSGQGSSKTVDIISLSCNLFRHKWLALPRSASAPRHRRQMASRQFSNVVSDHLVWETANSLVRGEVRDAKKSLATLLRLHPSSIWGVARRWSRISTLAVLLRSALAHDDMLSLKTRFKQLQTGEREWL